MNAVSIIFVSDVVVANPNLVELFALHFYENNPVPEHFSGIPVFGDENVPYWLSEMNMAI